MTNESTLKGQCKLSTLKGLTLNSRTAQKPANFVITSLSRNKSIQKSSPSHWDATDPNQIIRPIYELLWTKALIKLLTGNNPKPYGRGRICPLLGYVPSKNVNLSLFYASEETSAWKMLANGIDHLSWPPHFQHIQVGGGGGGSGGWGQATKQGESC